MTITQRVNAALDTAPNFRVAIEADVGSRSDLLAERDQLGSAT